MKPKRTLRSPFVMTVTAAALSSVGCGTYNPAPPFDTQQGSDATDVTTPNAMCPTSVPRAGSPCSTEGLSCDYMPCPPYFESARCTRGEWSIAYCNPPAPSDAGGGG